MKQLLLVVPHFPPVATPDSHRVRTSLPHYREFGWQPHVLAVDPRDAAPPADDTLAATLPAGVPVTRVRALPRALTRPFGVGDTGLRAAASLYRAGARVIRDAGIDLVYFPTTVVFAMPLGRLWLRRFGVPFVLDLQDAWYSTYYDDKPRAERPPKHRLAREVHRRLERWTMARAGGLTSVSDAYLAGVRARYPWIREERCATIPFGASAADFDAALAHPVTPPPGAPAGVSAGRGGDDLVTAHRILFRALRAARERSARLAGVHVSFLGTSYAGGAARPTVAPVAAAEGLGDRVTEITARQPYLAALGALARADFLVLAGSDDPAYSPSKVYPYILARRPIVAVLHEACPAVEVIRRTRAGLVVTFNGRDDVAGPAARLAGEWAALAGRLPWRPETDWAAFEPYSARRLTARQCRLFGEVAGLPPDADPEPCAG